MSASTSAGGELIVYGASDDLLEFEGAIRDEWSDPQHPIWVELRGPDSTPEKPVGLLVVATYTDAGTWAVGVAPLDEDVPLPHWLIRYRPAAEVIDRGYSAVLAITIPAGTTYTGANE